MSSDVVYALFTSHVNEYTMMKENDLYAADHPLVRQHPDWFSADLAKIAIKGSYVDEPYIEGEEPVEMVAELPRRGPGRPRKIETTARDFEVTT